jgi:WD40 repeat protein
LGVSIDPAPIEHNVISSVAQLHIPIARGVLLIDMQTKTIRAALNAHKDVVQCICPLPDGSILTAGGKMDAKICHWKSSDIANALSGDEATILTEAKAMQEPGYVFDLQVLRDSDPTSKVFAIAGARYNTIKIVI